MDPMSPRLRNGWVLGSLVLLAALLLAFVPFTRGEDGGRVCIAALRAWDSGPPEPSAEDREALAAPIIAGEPLTDPGALRAARYEEWRAGPGACRDPSRQRVVIALVILVAGAGFVAVVRRLAG